MSRILTKQIAADQMTCALEGGSNYWIDHITPIYESHKSYSEPAAYGPDMTPRHFYVEDDHNASLLNWDTLNRGFEVMRDEYPSHWADMVEENGDADTADVFLQCCLFGELVYG